MNLIKKPTKAKNPYGTKVVMIGGREFSFTLYTFSTSTGFSHYAELRDNDILIGNAKVNYSNRTWEAYTGQKAFSKALENAKENNALIGTEYAELTDYLRSLETRGEVTINNKKVIVEGTANWAMSAKGFPTFAGIFESEIDLETFERYDIDRDDEDAYEQLAKAMGYPTITSDYDIEDIQADIDDLNSDFRDKVDEVLNEYFDNTESTMADHEEQRTLERMANYDIFEDLPEVQFSPGYYEGFTIIVKYDEKYWPNTEVEGLNAVEKNLLETYLLPKFEELGKAHNLMKIEKLGSFSNGETIYTRTEGATAVAQAPKKAVAQAPKTATAVSRIYMIAASTTPSGFRVNVYDHDVNLLDSIYSIADYHVFESIATAAAKFGIDVYNDEEAKSIKYILNGKDITFSWLVTDYYELMDSYDKLKENTKPIKESTDKWVATQYKGKEWSVFDIRSNAHVLFGTEAAMKAKAKLLNKMFAIAGDRHVDAVEGREAREESTITEDTGAVTVGPLAIVKNTKSGDIRVKIYDNANDEKPSQSVLYRKSEWPKESEALADLAKHLEITFPGKGALAWYKDEFRTLNYLKGLKEESSGTMTQTEAKKRNDFWATIKFDASIDGFKLKVFNDDEVVKESSYVGVGKDELDALHVLSEQIMDLVYDLFNDYKDEDDFLIHFEDQWFSIKGLIEYVLANYGEASNTHADYVYLNDSATYPSEEIKSIHRRWTRLANMHGDEGSAVIGAGFYFNYNGQKYKMAPQSKWQGSMSWEAYIEEIKAALEKAGATDIYFDYGNMD